jgi:hypothetical protein
MMNIAILAHCAEWHDHECHDANLMALKNFTEPWKTSADLEFGLKQPNF